MRKRPKEIWLRTNERDELIGALEHSAELAGALGKNVIQWKWLILAFHNALQGACTCALRGRDTTGVTVLTKKSGQEVWHYLDVTRRHCADAIEHLAVTHPHFPASHDWQQMQAREKIAGEVTGSYRQVGG